MKKITGENITCNYRFSEDEERTLSYLSTLKFSKSNVEISEDLNISCHRLKRFLKNEIFYKELLKRNPKYEKDIKYTKKQRDAMYYLSQPRLGGKTFRDIARLIGISESTLSAWRNDPEFKQELEKYKIKFAHIKYVTDKQLEVIEKVSNHNEKSINTICIEQKINKNTLLKWMKDEVFCELLNEKIKEKGGTRFFESKVEEEFNIDELLTIVEARELLSINIKNIRFMLRLEVEYNLKPIKKDHAKYYKKIDIQNLQNIQSNLRQEYVSFKEANELLEENNIKSVLHSGAFGKSLSMPELLKPYYISTERLFKKNTIYEWIKNRKFRESLAFSLESDFETFQYRLDIIYPEGISIFLGKFTYTTYMDFVENKLRKSQYNSLESREKNINLLIKCGKALVDIVSISPNKEIYALTANQINLSFNNIYRKYAEQIYIYLKYTDRILKDLNKVSYDFSKINNLNIVQRKKLDKDIYDYELYRKVFSYCLEVALHKEWIIKDCIEEIEGRGKETTQTKNLSSSWLYLLIHLNNAWRHSDVIRFPRVSLKGTNIESLQWLLNNDISSEDVELIISRVYKTKLHTMKTKVKNYFFCSEEIKPILALAIAICELKVQEVAPLSDYLIIFNNKNNVFTEKYEKGFFKFFQEKDFKFSSMKMNRSLLTYIYLVLAKSGKGNEALAIVQRMRGHIEAETTNIYIEIPEKEMNFLSKQLFIRGDFGFISDIFLDLLGENKQVVEERTQQIERLKKFTNGVVNLENISRFINLVQEEQQAVIDYIYNLGLDETLNKLYMISTNQLPSKQSDIQCLMGVENCKYKGKNKECINCHYAIPNYYALSIIGEKINKNLYELLDMSFKANDLSAFEINKKYKLFYKNLDVFSKAREKFGDCVYEYLDFTREEFIHSLMQINSINTLQVEGEN